MDSYKEDIDIESNTIPYFYYRVDYHSVSSEGPVVILHGQPNGVGDEDVVKRIFINPDRDLVIVMFEDDAAVEIPLDRCILFSKPIKTLGENNETK